MPLVLLEHSVPCSHCPYWPCHHIVIVIFIHQNILVCIHVIKVQMGKWQKYPFYSGIVISLKWLRHFPFPFHLFFHFWMPYPAFIHNEVGKWHQPQNLFWICISCCKNMNRTITCFLASRLLSTSPQWQGWKEGIGWRVWALQKHRLGHNWRSWNEMYYQKH